MRFAKLLIELHAFKVALCQIHQLAPWTMDLPTDLPSMWISMHLYTSPLYLSPHFEHLGPAINAGSLSLERMPTRNGVLSRRSLVTTCLSR